MPSARADVDRQGRAADDRPRAARALRLPAARAPRRGRRRDAARGPVRPPAAARRRRRARRAQRAAAERGWPSRSRRSAAGVAPELVELGLWVAREYCSTPARGLDLVLPPGTARRAGRPGANRALATATPAAADALCGEAAARPRPAARRSSCSARPASRSAPASSRAAGVGRDALRRLERRGLVELGERGCAAARARPRSAPPAGGARARPGAAGGRSGSSPALDGGRGRAAAARGHRLGQDRGLSRRRGGGARPRARGDRAGPGDRDDAAGGVALSARASATASRFCTRACRRASAATSGTGCADGEARICVGPRSAIFAPIERPRA